MKFRYLRAFIVLLAGLITLIINIKTGKNVTLSLIILLIVLIIFYFVATLLVEILQFYLERWEASKEMAVQVAENEEEELPEEADDIEENEDNEQFLFDEE